MRHKTFATWFSVLMLSLVLAWPSARAAQSTPEAPAFKREEMQQLLAPIALYPDQLLAQVLMASTYPLQVVQGARWQKENAKLKGAALDKALGGKDWDPSVKSLVPFPQVLQMMNDRLEWTQKLGDAFLAQQADVMAEVQFLRGKASEAGNLKSTEQQKVTTQSAPSGSSQKEVIVIAPASPQVVYVPVYNPMVIYGAWWYPTYPPYYYPAPAGAAFVAGFYWGAAVATSPKYWGWSNCNWHGHNINVNVAHYNQINVNRARVNSATVNRAEINSVTTNRAQLNSGTWQHNSANRGPVPYRDAKSREQYGQAPRPTQVSRDARGYASTSTVSRAATTTTKSTSAAASTRGTTARTSAAAARPSSAAAFDVGAGRNARAQASRGHVSRQAASASGGRRIRR